MIPGQNREVETAQGQEEDSAEGETVEGTEPDSTAECCSVSGPVSVPADKSYEEMTVEELQAAILEKMAENGPVTAEMRRTVEENIWHNSLVNWVKSFR